MEGLKRWLETQCAERLVEPNSSLGKAISSLLGHWETLTRFFSVPGAPLDNNTVERALKLFIRQRKNSLLYATEHSAYIASVLTSLIATCLHAGVNALEYLVALQEHRREVFQAPAAWLPWNYPANLVPPEPNVRQSSAIWACRGSPFHRRIDNSRAAKGALGPWEEGHHWKRPCESRWLHSQ